ncbi:MAG TPA: hypothetical protein VNA17_01400 [Pyrinomonadaceae bacterium]|nr:hypothetical protein [Pyrinomonadaceae bacterium]
MRKDENTISRDVTVTIDIAAGGASTQHEPRRSGGDKIKLAFKEANLFTIAEVKGRRLDDGNPPSLHLEFLENRFPLASVVNARMQNRGGFMRMCHHGTPFRALRESTIVHLAASGQ